MPARPLRYHWMQIVLYWGTLLLVLGTYLTGTAVIHTHALALGQLAPAPSDLFLHAIHNGVSILLGAIVALRIVLWFVLRRPTPLYKPGSVLHRLADLTHVTLYFLLLVLASTGVVAAYLWFPISAVHRVVFPTFLVVLALHVAASLWQVVVRRDDAGWRITSLPVLRQTHIGAVR